MKRMAWLVLMTAAALSGCTQAPPEQQIINDAAAAVGGGDKIAAVKTIVIEGAPKYGALYEIESPDVLVTEAWATAVEKGRWPAQVRPHTRNRQHLLYRRITP